MRSIILPTLMFLVVLPATGQTPSGKTLLLDGAGDLVTVPDAPSLDLVGEITIEALVLPLSFSAGATVNGNPILTKWKTDLSTQGSWFATIDSVGRPVFAVSNDGINGQPPATTATQVATDVFSHLAFSYSVAENVLRMYVNGTEVGTQTGNAGLFASSSPVLIGAADYFEGKFYFHGELDEVRVWSRVRTPGEIQTTMNGALPAAYYATADSGLVGYWQFDALEDLGVGGDGADDLRDLSVFGNHGDLAGNAQVVDPGTSVSVEQVDAGIPATFALHQNYPNPFNPSTTIRFEVKDAHHVALEVFDVFGRKVDELVSETLAPGSYEVAFSAQGLASGAYIYRLRTGTTEQTRTMLLLR